MDALADLERLLERVFERSTARIFRARLQVVQVERKIERAMERARVTQGGHTVVPSRYRVRLNAVDLGSLADGAGGAEALAGMLADASLGFARAHGYHLGGRPTVALVSDPAIERGLVEVDAVGDSRRAGTAAAGPDAVPAIPLASIPDVPPASSASWAGPPAPVLAEPESVVPAPVPAPVPVPATGPGVAPAPPLEPQPAFTGIRGDGTQTMVFRRPPPEAARAMLRVLALDGSERTVAVDATPLTVGRSSDNILVLVDARVSRHHGRLQTRRGTLVYTDLASTNGSRVNGIRVDECALGAGDRVLIGDTVLLVEQLPG